MGSAITFSVDRDTALVNFVQEPFPEWDFYKQARDACSLIADELSVRSVLIDLTNCKYISDIGTENLMRIWRQSTVRGLHTVFAVPDDNVLGVLRLARLDHLWQIFDSIESAQKSIEDDRSSHASESPSSASQIAGPIRVYIDSNEYSSAEKVEILSLFSELYSLQSGDWLIIDNTGQAQPQLELVGPPGGGE